MLEATPPMAPVWLNIDVILRRLRVYTCLMGWAHEPGELDLHFMVGRSDFLWNAIGACPNVGEKEGILAYAVVTITDQEC